MATRDKEALFEVLNAKKMSPTEIAATFVIPPQYDQLVSPDHSFLVGPRGSGKTTLLRMLQGEALMAWDHRRAPEYRRRIRYSSVFLPADRLWASQVPNADDSVSNSDLGLAAFTTQLLYALVEAMLYRIGEYQEVDSVHNPATLSHLAEVSLVSECAEGWGIDARTPSLLSLQGALDLRLNRLANQIEQSHGDSSPPDFASSQLPMEAFRLGIRAFNRHSRQPHHRWALLLDEMELAPESVHQSLRGSLRGGEANLVLKLSFSPFDRYALAKPEVGGAAPHNDFRPIYLWYGTRSGARKFTTGLWRRMMKEQLGTVRDPSSVLGHSEIDVSGSTWRKDSYNAGSKRMRLVEKTARQDPGFSEFLRNRDIDLGRVSDLSYAQRSATLRKVYPLLVFRDAVLTFEDGTPVRRARKKLTECFTGADAVFAALEGNPRWTKAVFSQLLAVYDGQQVGRGFQYDMLTDAAERFESLLRLLPPDGPVYSSRSVLSFLNDVAAYFSAQACGDFTADPPTAFRVDSKVGPEVIAALKTALSAGAVVHLRSKESPAVLSDLVGERFRLAYLLTLRDGFESPMRMGKLRNLSTIMTWARIERQRRGLLDADPTLWDSSGAES